MERIIGTAFGVLGLLLVSAHAPASAQNLFNKLVDASKAEMAKKMAQAEAASKGPSQ